MLILSVVTVVCWDSLRRMMSTMNVSKDVCRKQFPKNYTSLVDNLSSTEANVPISNDMTAFPIEMRELYPNGLTTIVPIYGAGERLGTIILSRIEKRSMTMI